MQPHHNSPPNEPKTQGRVMIARMFWFFVGPMILACLALAIVSAGTGWTTWLDAAFLLVFGVMVLARWYELRSGQGYDSYGNPAGPDEFAKYCRGALPIALAVWAAANVLGNHVMN
jgi:hypothetical protein